MKIKLVGLEDGIISCGYRKMAATVRSLNPDTEVYYVSTSNYRSVWNQIRGKQAGAGEFDDDAVTEIAESLADADLVGFSSMTGYAGATGAIIGRLRQLSSHPYIIWGGIHPIIHAEDALQADVDAVCTGEGEFAFAEFLDLFQQEKDFTGVRNFHFKTRDGIIRNGFRPLMRPEELEALPFPVCDGDERIYRKGRGFVPLRRRDYLASNGLSYMTIWSIGCPFRCTFCGNTKFIENDPKYKRIRHPSARYVIEEVKQARRTLPHLSQVTFYDDSFMAIPLRELTELAELWRQEIALPFAVYGVIPNYVRRDKLEVLTWAGMNRIRMGVQSASEQILDFYKRPSSLEKIEKATELIGSFTPRYHIPPAYDVIVDNPIETRQDVVDTLNFFWRIARPYTLFIYSLKIIPNTEMERQMRERGVELEDISTNYVSIPPRLANVLIFLLILWKPPRWIFDRLLERVQPCSRPQKMYPMLLSTIRLLGFAKRGLDHLRFMDFSIIPGYAGWLFWRLGIVSFWWRHFCPRPPKPDCLTRVPAVRVAADGAETESATQGTSGSRP